MFVIVSSIASLFGGLGAGSMPWFWSGGSRAKWQASLVPFPFDPFRGWQGLVFHSLCIWFFVVLWLFWLVHVVIGRFRKPISRLLLPERGVECELVERQALTPSLDNPRPRPFGKPQRHRNNLLIQLPGKLIKKTFGQVCTEIWTRMIKVSINQWLKMYWLTKKTLEVARAVRWKVFSQNPFFFFKLCPILFCLRFHVDFIIPSKILTYLLVWEAK